MDKRAQNTSRFLHASLIFTIILSIAYVALEASIINASIMLLLFTFFYLVTLRQLKRYTTCPCEITPALNTVTPHVNNKKKLFIITVLISYILVSWLLYYSWLKGDDFGWLIFGSQPLLEKIRIIGGNHLHWVSRHGDTIATIIGGSLNHWQVWILTSAVIALAPLAICRLFKRKTESTISTGNIGLYLFILAVILSQSGRGWWTNFTCFNFSTVYTWTVVGTVLFLSYYNKYNWVHSLHDKSSYYKSIWIFLLGIYSGWGTECLTVIILPILAIYCLYKHVKRLYIPLSCYIGLLGYILGAIFLFVSPAHSFRAKVAASFRGIVPENLTYDEIWNFCTDITYEKLCMLGEPNVTLQGIPYHLHIFFFPRVAELFWNESKIATITLLILIVIACFNKSINKLKLFLVTLGLSFIAWICASSYLAQCIPTSASFVPPVFFIIGGCAYIFIELSRKQKIGVLILSLCYMFWNIFPSAVEAYEYKKYELAWFKEIQIQKDNGIQDIILKPLPSEPINRLFLIKSNHLTENADAGTNKCLAQYFRVNSIRIQSHNTSK